MPSHCSAFCRSINRSCLLRQAFDDFNGKCLGAIWFQFIPWARAWIRVSSSLVDHDELRAPPTPPAAEATELEGRWDVDVTFSTLGMVIMGKVAKGKRERD